MPYPLLHVVGLGPGSPALLAPEALECIRRAETVVGYAGYVDLVDPALLQGKEIVSTGMMGEMERTEAALESALAGRETVMVCSGDPGVYALAGLALELIEGRGLNPGAVLNVVPGVPAVCAAAALLGAPLMHDFACVSLSDLLTPAELIEKRLECALAGDFVTVLYNPRSKRRTVLLDKALALAARYRGEHAPVGVVRNAFRPEQEVRIARLSDNPAEGADMFSLFLIGNSETRIVPGGSEGSLAWECGARLLTPRGYLKKYEAGTGALKRRA